MRGIVTSRRPGLHAPNKQGGVIPASVPAIHFADAADKDMQLDYLATRLYRGGSHGIFSKTEGAGLAYIAHVSLHRALRARPHTLTPA